MNKLLNLTVPKNEYFLEFLAKRKEEELRNSWIFIHDSITNQLLNEYNFNNRAGINGLRLFSRNAKELIVLLPITRYWYMLFAIDSKYITYDESYFYERELSDIICFKMDSDS